MSRLSRRDLGALAGALVFASLRSAGASDDSRTHDVEIHRFAYRPAVLTVAPGDSVRWLNRDPAPHTATDRRGNWDTGEIGHGEVRTVTFPSPGRHRYFCAYHPHMTAEVIVAAPRQGAAAHHIEPTRRNGPWA